MDKKYRGRLRDESLDMNQLGKLPPQATDLEEAVIGTIMLVKGAFVKAMGILNKDSFYKEAHKEIWNACATLNAESNPIDVLTVTQQLRKEGKLEFVGGPYFLGQMTDKVHGDENIEYHSRIIFERALSRNIIYLCSKFQSAAYEDSHDALELLAEAQLEFSKVSASLNSSSHETIGQLVTKKIEDLDKPPLKEGDVPGIRSGFYRLDKLTTGFHPAELIIISGRPGMGKSALMADMTKAGGINNVPTAIIGFEMLNQEFGNRIISSHTSVDYKKVRGGQNYEDKDKQRIIERTADLVSAPIFLVDDCPTNIEDIVAKIHQLVTEEGVKQVFLDYLQLIFVRGWSGNRVLEIQQITSTLKSTAKSLRIPIILGSQLSRAVETDDKTWRRPKLHHLRDGGSIEQDADMVLFLWRPAHYKIECDREGSPYPNGYTEIIIAKQRNGDLGTATIKFVGAIQKFFDENPYGLESEPGLTPIGEVTIPDDEYLPF